MSRFGNRISRRRYWWVVMSVAAVAAIGWWAGGGRRHAPSAADLQEVRGAPAEQAPKPTGRAPAPPMPAARRAAPDAQAAHAEAAADDAASETNQDDAASETNQDEAAMAWANVDLEAVRKAMPDNLYFKMSAPTKDPEVLQQREDERARWNVEYGKVLSGTGTEEEIRAYYDLRARLSTDYVEFATYLLDHYGDRLPERDVGMLKLARRLNLARLEEIPRKVEVALERKRQQDEARQAWLADQAEFGASGADSE